MHLLHDNISGLVCFGFKGTATILKLRSDAMQYNAQKSKFEKF
ncbi:hypothetical protein NIASO_01230 [Niabella soli DSM 19437]|uniref:Uncharacterized protein n=1 Tax=Niabella soli DSM 19437 TaxID=929713 RepID=W0F1Z2_9BACT|nr:hypothetical protein NIASO_01230 [Niabella soli DSM 19437]